MRITTGVVSGCSSSPIAEEEITSALKAALSREIPEFQFTDKLPADLTIIFALTDYLPKQKECSKTRWHWGGDVSTWYPLADNESSTASVALLNFEGETEKAGSYAEEFARALAGVRGNPGSLPPSNLLCISVGKWVPSAK